jgi:hypothetical protein
MTDNKLIKETVDKINSSTVYIEPGEPRFNWLNGMESVECSKIEGWDIFTQDNKLYLRLDLMINDLTEENIIGEEIFRKDFEKLIFDFMVKYTRVRMNKEEIK